MVGLAKQLGAPFPSPLPKMRRVELREDGQQVGFKHEGGQLPEQLGWWWARESDALLKVASIGAQRSALSRVRAKTKQFNKTWPTLTCHGRLISSQSCSGPLKAPVEVGLK